MQAKEKPTRRLALVSSTAAAADAAEPSAGTSAPHPGDMTALSFLDAAYDRYYETAALRECHNRVMRAAFEDDTVVLVEGEQGGGKTTFLHKFIKQAGPGRDICHIETSMPLGEQQLLGLLQQSFCPGEPHDREQLTAQLIERGKRNRGCLIVVDDAGNLSPFAVKLLFELKLAVTRAGARLAVVLTGRPLEIGAVLELPSFGAYAREWLSRVELPRLTAEETADYLRHRIEAAGLTQQISFDQAQQRRIYRASSGLPQHVKRSAGELLAGNRPKPYRSEQQRLRSVQIRNALIPAGIMGALLICIAYLLHALLITPSPSEALLESVMPPADIMADNITPPVEAGGSSVPIVTGAVDRAGAGNAAPAPPVTSTKKAEKQAEAAPPAAAHPAAVPRDDEPRPAVIPHPVATEEPRPVAQVSKPIAAKAPEVAEPVSGEPPSASPVVTHAPETADSSAPPSGVSAPQAVGDLEAIAVPKAVAPVAAGAADLAGNAWLKAQDPDRYTIQLAGAPERKEAEDFAARQTLLGKISVVEVLRNNKSWYMVLYNSYQTSAEARRDIDALPPAVLRNDPFARRISSAQAIMVKP